MAGRHHQHAGSNKRASPSRAFAASIALTSLFYNLFVAASCAYLPDDPLLIGVSIQYYACAGSVLSALGLVGIATKNYALTISLALFLLVDAFLSSIVRLLVLEFFFKEFQDFNVCESSYDPAWTPRNFRHDIVTSVRFQKEYISQARHQQTCRLALGATQVVFVGVLICFTAAQASLAMTVRQCAKELGRKKGERLEVAMAGVISEKPRRSQELSRFSPHDEKLASSFA